MIFHIFLGGLYLVALTGFASLICKANHRHGARVRESRYAQPIEK